MRKYKIATFIFILLLLFNHKIYAEKINHEGFLKAYCGSAVLSEALSNLGINHQEAKANQAVAELTDLANQNHGINSLYEIKLACQKAGLKTKVLRPDLVKLQSLIKAGQLIVNITGNRHFALLEDITPETVSLYIPGLNHEHPTIPLGEFLEYWDNQVILLVSKKELNLAKYQGSFKPVREEELKNILGGQPCSNCTGGGGNYPSGTAYTGNGSAASASDSSTARTDTTTKEPVVLRNGNLSFEIEDIGVATRSLPLKLKRYYNSEVVSEVVGWITEPCAGSWVIENGEYSAQGNRSFTEAKFADFSLELDMQTVQPGTNHSWETAWINIRYQENPNNPRKAYNGYYFLIHTNGKIELTKWKNGSQYWLYNKPTSYRPTNKNHIRIEALGANIKVYINGSLEIDYTDTNNPLLSAGRIALESFFSHSHFDNLSITSGTQTYNYDFSLDDNEFIFGYGWTHSYALRLKEYPNHVTLYRENNSKEIYVPNGDGTYFSFPVNYYTPLTKDGAGFSLKTKYGVHYRFDLSGQLQYLEDRNLNRTGLTYSNINGKTLLTSVTEPAGRKITFTYGANNLVSKATDPQGNYLQYFYDATGHLVRVVDRNGNTTNYSYDATTHNLNALTDPQGNTFTYNYTYNDRVNDQTDPLGNTTTFDYIWDTVHVINQRNEVYKYNFDNHEFLQSITNPKNVIERTNNDASGNITNYYDKNGNHTYFTYDAQGNSTGIYDAFNKWTRFTYEPTFNQPTSFTDAKGNVTNFSYDAKGNLIQVVNPEGGVVNYTYNTYGQLASLEDARGNITRFEYDGYGNLSRRTDAQNNTTTYTYDILGRLTKITDALGNATEYTYDKNGNLLSVKDALGEITRYTYTAVDNLASVRDALGNTTSYTYDCFGNLLSVRDAQGNTTTYTYDTANQMHLDKANLLSITDSRASTTTYAYDSLDRLIKTTDVAGASYQFVYDRQGNLTSRIDALAKTTTYYYDALNRLYKIRDPQANLFNYTYDEVGNLTRVSDYADNISYTYDKLNRRKSQVYLDGTRLDYAYDANSNRLSLEMSGLGKIFYDYDNLNRLTQITAPANQITQFSYDQLSHRTQLNYPNGAMATYGYDALSQLTELISSAKDGQIISGLFYRYDALSRRTRVDLDVGAWVNYAYDSLNEVLSEAGVIDQRNFSTAYAYDQVGNRLNLAEDNLSTDYAYNTLNQPIRSTSIPQKFIPVRGTVSADQPVSVKVNGIPATVSGTQFTAENIPLTLGENTLRAEATDALGNTGSHQISVTYQVPLPTGPTIIDYTFDVNGNLIEKRSAPDVSETFSYDFENRLRSYTSPNQNATYTYNGEGKRLSKTVNGITTKYYYDGDEVVLEKTGTSSIYYIHGPRIDEIISDSRGYCYHTDGLGSVVNLTDASGNKVASYTYDAFGNLRKQEGTIANSWLFTGRQLDAESGLYFYRNRYYDPRIGRFITQDPSLTLNALMPYLLPNQLTNPLELNKYLYCINNPVNWIDPWGLEGGGREGDEGGLSSQLLIALAISQADTPAPGPADIAAIVVATYAVSNYAVHQFSKYNKKGPLWNAPGMPGWKIKQYEQNQPGAFKPPPNFKNWRDKLFWITTQLARLFNNLQGGK